MSEQQNNQQAQIGKEISVKGMIKAIFNDIAHIQVGSKVITVNIKDLGTQ
ncbi:hypothetical protein [Priestia koreensis]|nr:hypothetical protein [Priestia koreensis]